MIPPSSYQIGISDCPQHGLNAGLIFPAAKQLILENLDPDMPELKEGARLLRELEHYRHPPEELLERTRARLEELDDRIQDIIAHRKAQYN